MRITKRFSIAVVPLAVCLLLATALWMYASMREQYTTIIDIPLEIRLPPGRALETEIAPIVRAQVQGAGWQLVNHFLSSAIRCVIYIPEKRLREERSFVAVSRLMLSQAVQAPPGVNVQRIVSDSLFVAVGSITEKRVPVAVVTDVRPRDGFIVLSPTVIQPESVTIRSGRLMLDKITSWRTEPIILRDLYEPTVVLTDLVDTLAGVVQVSRVPITVNLNVRQMAEVRFDDLPVRIVGTAVPPNVVIIPSAVTVVLRGGLDGIAQLKADDVQVTVEYNKANGNAVRPRISAPREVHVVGTEPVYVRCMTRIASP